MREAPKKPISQLTKMERWLAYFANQLTKEERRELAMKDEKIKDALDATQVFLSDKEERRRYINREMAIMDCRSELASVRDETMLENIRNFVAGTGWSVERVMDMLKIPEQERPRYLDLLQKNLH
ncbi:PD-(D/E)XK nuclease family transposase [Mitsuokella sp.]|uniref:PD-(D/E)XK nuclease family transposase n=1 Tax=Mitsuokella sp. TaxID=2049034 RepID=UPI003D7E5A15